MLLNNVKKINTNNKQGFLGVIIPYRHSDTRQDALTRIERIITTKHSEKVIFYVVDSGSPFEVSSKLEDLCINNGAEYIYADTSHELFSPGKARDIGAVYANTEYIMFQDIDCLAYDGFYEEIIREIDNENLKEIQNDFLIIPCLFLTEDGSVEYLKTPGYQRKQKFMKFLYEASPYIKMLAPISSSIVINRLYYLSMGGHFKEFRGHGFEDFELIHRLATYSNKFVRPVDYYTDKKKWNTNEYSGFRSMFRLYGDLMLLKGIFLCHIWHKPNPPSYQNQNSQNALLLVEKMKEFDEKYTNPETLPDLKQGRTLCLGKPTDSFYKSIWQVMPSFGLLFFKSEYDFDDPSDLLRYLDEMNIDRTVMPNPYGNEKRLSLYKVLRENGRKFIVSDRGALTDSIFFDENGFNADSKSYHPIYWDRELSEEEIKYVEEYIKKEKYTDDALEAQGKRIGSDALAEKYHISNKKVLFVPFQRPSDTVIRYFSGSVKDMDEFVKFVENVADNLGEEWVVIAKKHPLETMRPMSEKILFVDDDTHIKDLLELATAVLLINSGVGVLAMLWEKPVLYVGEAFYGIEGINKRVQTPSEAIYHLENLYIVDRSKMYRFIYYLVRKFYSFGKVRYEIIEKEDGSKFAVTRDIRFYSIKLPNQAERTFLFREKPAINFESILFDRYRPYLNAKKSQKKNKDKNRNINVTQDQETKLEWMGRQLVKLVTNPKKFKKHYVRWKKKRKKLKQKQRLQLQ